MRLQLQTALTEKTTFEWKPEGSGGATRRLPEERFQAKETKCKGLSGCEPREVKDKQSGQYSWSTASERDSGWEGVRATVQTGHAEWAIGSILASLLSLYPSAIAWKETTVDSLWYIINLYFAHITTGQLRTSQIYAGLNWTVLNGSSGPCLRQVSLILLEQLD